MSAGCVPCNDRTETSFVRFIGIIHLIFVVEGDEGDIISIVIVVEGDEGDIISIVIVVEVMKVILSPLLLLLSCTWLTKYMTVTDEMNDRHQMNDAYKADERSLRSIIARNTTCTQEHASLKIIIY